MERLNDGKVRNIPSFRPSVVRSLPHFFSNGYFLK